MSKTNLAVKAATDKISNAILDEETVKELSAIFRVKNISPKKFANIVRNEVLQNPDLQKCTPESIVDSMMAMARTGLMVGNLAGHGYLVPFKSGNTNSYVCTFIPGYKGIIHKMMSSKDILTVRTEIVYEGDEFEEINGLEPTIVHKKKNLSTNYTHVYCVVKLANGEYQFKVLTKEQVEKKMKMSKMYKAHGKKFYGVEHPESYARKQAILEIKNEVPIDYDAAELLSYDSDLDRGVVREVGKNNYSDPDSEPEEPESQWQEAVVVEEEKAEEVKKKNQERASKLSEEADKALFGDQKK